MSIIYKNTITVDEVNAIRKSMGWRQWHPEQIKEMLDNNELLAAYDGDKAVGMVFLGGTITLYITLEYQNQGIEKEFITRIFDSKRAVLKPGYGTQVHIRAFNAEQISLYESLGFEISTPEKLGVPMHTCLTNQIEITDKMFKQMEFKEE